MTIGIAGTAQNTTSLRRTMMKIDIVEGKREEMIEIGTVVEIEMKNITGISIGMKEVRAIGLGDHQVEKDVVDPRVNPILEIKDPLAGIGSQSLFIQGDLRKLQ